MLRPERRDTAEGTRPLIPARGVAMSKIGKSRVSHQATDKPAASRPGGPSVADSREIPVPSSTATQPYSADLADYLDRLLDEALKETFPASDAVAIPSLRELESK